MRTLTPANPRATDWQIAHCLASRQLSMTPDSVGTLAVGCSRYRLAVPVAETVALSVAKTVAVPAST